MTVDFIPRDRKLNIGEYIAKVHSVRFKYTKRQKTSYTIRKIIDTNWRDHLLRRWLLGVDVVEDMPDWEFVICQNVTLWDKLLYILWFKRSNIQRKEY